MDKFGVAVGIDNDMGDEKKLRLLEDRRVVSAIRGTSR
jgi:hypothetical protein